MHMHTWPASVWEPAYTPTSFAVRVEQYTYRIYDMANFDDSVAVLILTLTSFIWLGELMYRSAINICSSGCTFEDWLALARV